MNQPLNPCASTSGQQPEKTNEDLRNYVPGSLHWYALNYRTAQTVGDAAAAWAFLDGHVARLIEDAVCAERERCAKLAETGDYERITLGLDPFDSVGRMIASAIRRAFPANFPLKHRDFIGE